MPTINSDTNSEFCDNCYAWLDDHYVAFYTIKCLYAPTCMESAKCLFCGLMITYFAHYTLYNYARVYLHANCLQNIRWDFELPYATVHEAVNTYMGRLCL